MNLSDAKREVVAFFRNYAKNTRPALLKSGKGKVYELYCLARTVAFLKRFSGAQIRFEGTRVDFKASPGKIDHRRSYFVVYDSGAEFELHTDIEVRTLTAAWRPHVVGPSSYFEIDLVLVAGARHQQRPAHDQIVLGVECKAHANFSKDSVKQVLGVRRELSIRRSGALRSFVPLTGWERYVNAHPPSEFWFAFIDPKGLRYRLAPAIFSIEFRHWCPR